MSVKLLSLTPKEENGLRFFENRVLRYLSLRGMRYQGCGEGSKNVWSFLISRGFITFSGRIVLHGVDYTENLSSFFIMSVTAFNNHKIVKKPTNCTYV
jgi:hypothetical protein